jgi:hypothetical protein
LTPRGCVGAKHSFAYGREESAAAAFEHYQGLAELALIRTQEPPGRPIRQATVSNGCSERTCFGYRP